jgi:hypothetical protein
MSSREEWVVGDIFLERTRSMLLDYITNRLLLFYALKGRRR